MSLLSIFCSRVVSLLSSNITVPKLQNNLRESASTGAAAGTMTTGASLTNNASQTSNAEKYNFKYLNSPVKADNDLKEYKVIELSNGLRAVLVSDAANLQHVTQCLDELTESDNEGEEGSSHPGSEASETDGSDSGGESDSSAEGSAGVVKKQCDNEEKMAAVGLSVGVGSFSDPADVPGLAHFLEHMVFMGSKKYPRENDFDVFIKLQDGYDNAQTGCEVTTYYFECQEKYLLLAMDKFVQFFTEPLLKMEAMTRERQAVESEFQESLQSDYHRVVQLVAGMARDGHPAGKFTWGNEETLRDACTDAALHEALRSFRSRHYSAHRITLAVQARLPMAELERYVAETFSAVPSNSLPSDDFSRYKDSFDTPDFHRLYRVRSTKDKINLLLSWALPPILHLYASSPDLHLQYLLGHEGEGSLLHHLREKLWSLTLSAANDEDFSNNSMFHMFTVDIELTDQGYQHVDQVISAVFSHLSMLRAAGVQEWFHREMQAIQRMTFDHADEAEAIKNVEEFCDALQVKLPEHLNTARFMVLEYNPEMIGKMLAALTPDKVNVIIASLDSTIDYNLREKWFKTEYNVADIPATWLTEWEVAGPAPWSKLPPPNKFLPTDFSLLGDPGGRTSESPELIATSDLMEVWYKQDVKFKQPRAFYNFHLISDIVDASPLNAAMLELYVDLLGLELAAPLYAARVADAVYVICVTNHGLTVKVRGFCQKLPVVVEAIVQHMAAFTTKQGMFEAVKLDRIKAYYNVAIKPNKLNSDLRLKVLVNRHWTALEKKDAVVAVTAPMLDDFVGRFHRRLRVQALVQGNATREQALQASDAVVKTLRCEAIPEAERPQHRVKQLGLQQGRVLRAEALNPEDKNSVITNYYQSGLGSMRTLCVADYIMTKMSEPLFDQLRTKQQLGYDVSCEIKDTYGVLGFTVTVHYQEQKHSADDVNKRIEDFLESYLQKTEAMSDKSFDEYRCTLIKSKLCVDVHLKEEVDRNWCEITNHEYVFDRRHKEVAILQAMSASDVQKWFSEHLPSGPAFRKLSIQVVGWSDSTPKPEEKKESKREKRAVAVDAEPTDSGKELKAQVQLKLIPVEGDESFVRNVEEFRDSLLLLPCHKVTA